MSITIRIVHKLDKSFDMHVHDPARGESKSNYKKQDQLQFDLEQFLQTYLYPENPKETGESTIVYFEQEIANASID